MRSHSRLQPVRRGNHRLGSLIGFALAIATVAPLASPPTVATAATCSPPTFGARTAVNGANDPEDIIAADVNGDTRPDLVVANFSGSVATFLNDGSGTFGSAITSASGGSTGVNYAVQAGDFDEDGKTDLVVVQPYDDAVRMLHGDGAGHFTIAGTAAPGAFPTTLEVGDVDGDTNLDVVVASLTKNYVSVLYGDGAGHLSAPAPVGFSGLSSPSDVALGDLDGNGYRDVAVASLETDRVLAVPNQGSRAFGSQRTVTVQDGPYRLSIGDMNRDGNLDVVVGYFNDNRVSVVRGKGVGFGSGGFGAITDVDQGSPTSGLSLGDVDADGDLDVMTVGLSSLFTTFPDFVRVLTNDGSGALAVATTIDVPSVTEEPDAIAVGNFDADGALDIADTDYLESPLSVFRGTCVLALPDLQVTGVEVTQGIQSVANDVSLVEGRRTFVRAHISSGITIDGVTARLVRTDTGGAVIDRPLWPANPTGEITVKPSPDRKLLGDSFLFELPEVWTHGSVNLRVEVNPDHVPSESSYTNNAATRSVSFLATDALKVELIRVKVHIGAGSDTGCGQDAVPDEFRLDMIESAIRRMMPAATFKITRSSWDSGLVIPCVEDGGIVAKTVVKALKTAYAGSPNDRIRVGLYDYGSIAGYADPALEDPATFFNPLVGWYAAADAGDPDTVVHEIVHDMGRRHVASPTTAPCSATGSPGGLDTAYPYPEGRIGGPAGTEQYLGFDPGDASLHWPQPRRVIGPDTGDIMTYCQEQWPSDYTWKRVRDAIQLKFTPADPVGDFLTVTGTIDLGAGTIPDLAAVRRSQIGAFGAPPPGTYHLELLDAASSVLSDTTFSAYADHAGDATQIDLTVDFVAGTRRIVVTDGGGSVLGSLTVSPNPPTVGNVTVSGGAAIPPTGPVTVTWTQSDPDGDPIVADVQWSADGGISFAPLGSGITTSSFTVDGSAFTSTGGAPNGIVRVLVRDPVNSAADQTGGLSAVGTAPTVRVGAPAPGQMFVAGQNVALEAFAADGDDGSLDSSITWTSDLDGPLGGGSHLTSLLSEGSHTLTARVVDGDGNVETRTVAVTVASVLPPGSPPVADAGPDQAVLEGATVTLDATGSTDPDGDSLAYSWSVLNTPPGVVGAVLDGPAATPSFQARDNGTYRFLLTVSDGTHDAVTDTVDISVGNSPPSVAITAPSPNTLMPMGPATVGASFADQGPLDTHDCLVTWDVDQPTPPDTGALSEENHTCTATRTLGAGVYQIQVEIVDDDGGRGSATVSLIVYDPTAGFVTGGGTIASPKGALVADPSVSGVASFGFTSRYKRRATVPTGETEFRLHVAKWRFHSASYEWLVVAGSKAQYKGIGEVNGVSGFGFLLTAQDAQLRKSGGADRFRIKVWNRATGAVVYDNVSGAPEDIDVAAPQAIASGSIVIHRA